MRLCYVDPEFNTINTIKMTHRLMNKQHGGMRFSRKALEILIQRGVDHNEDYNDFNVIKFLIAHASGLRIVWDASTYSFIFELTFPDGLIDPYGLPLDESVATLAAFTAGAPETGTRVSTFCAKISFVHDGPDSLRNEYKKVRKQTVTSDKANGEADTQRMLFEAFACRRTTAPFVPDVIAHSILTGPQFLAIFGPSQTTAGILSSTVASTIPGVLGTPKEIYDWIDAWIASDGIMVDVILMEMMDFQRTAPGVARTQPFTMIHQLRSQSHASHQRAALRMMAEIATVRGKRIMPHDFHEGNGLATTDGLQLYLIDWGGLFNLNIAADRHRLLSIFEDMCRQSHNTDMDASLHAKALVTTASADNKKRIARFPSLEELCGFFQIGFHDNTVPDYRIKNVDKLKDAFQQRLMACVDFTCVPPTPQNVHSALMMVAFVDFMTNRMEFNHPYCQCGGVLKVVYPDQDGTVPTSTHGLTVTAFDDFRTFLKTFAVASFPAITAHIKLLEVVAMIEENVRLCPSACGGVPLHVTHLRANSWINDEIQKERVRVQAEKKAEAKRLAAEAIRLAAEADREAIRLAAEADREAIRLAAEADREAIRLAAEAELAKKLTAKAEASRMRLENMGRSKGVAKPNKTLSKPDANKKVKQAAEAQQASAAQSAQSAAQQASAAQSAQPAQTAQASAASVQVAVPTSWLARVSSRVSNWSLPSWLKKRGGTRKQCKQHKQHKQRKQRKSFTKCRHN